MNHTILAENFRRKIDHGISRSAPSLSVDSEYSIYQQPPPRSALLLLLSSPIFKTELSLFNDLPEAPTRQYSMRGTLYIGWTKTQQY